MSSSFITTNNINVRNICFILLLTIDCAINVRQLLIGSFAKKLKFNSLSRSFVKEHCEVELDSFFPSFFYLHCIW